MKEREGQGAFDEKSLRAEIVKTWGEYGAHVVVFDMLLEAARRASHANQFPASTTNMHFCHGAVIPGMIQGSVEDCQMCKPPNQPIKPPNPEGGESFKTILKEIFLRMTASNPSKWIDPFEAMKQILDAYTQATERGRREAEALKAQNELLKAGLDMSDEKLAEIMYPEISKLKAQLAEVKAERDRYLNNLQSMKPLWAVNQQLAEAKAELNRRVLGSLTALEYTRLLEWMNDTKKKPANIAFTAGAARDAAYAFERCSLQADLSSAQAKIKKLESALELIAAPKRPDGTYNRCREACEKLAKSALTDEKS